ncbi:hypothetical protein KRZ98_18210 [Sphingobium sp. AS12]|uniref:terminase small subunit-like protein n=1 Tax=Sphingobium sp. AS12 TaxID=2849495 RepID=UPI001C318C57|nr:hypothetical protein [Sphingobium sp. AS12]MBV2150172.1 hypothetical protein [Sphingobium sp. AS12]
MAKNTTQTTRAKSHCDALSVAAQSKAIAAQEAKQEVAEIVKRKAGQPTKFSPEKWELILEAVATYQDLIEICQQPDMPSVQTIYRWMRESPELKQDMRDAWEMFSMIGKSVNNNILRGGVLSSGDKQRDFELASDNRWFMGKTNRRDFGDRQQIEITTFEPVILDGQIIQGPGGDGV